MDALSDAQVPITLCDFKTGLIILEIVCHSMLVGPNRGLLVVQYTIFNADIYI